MLNRRLTGYEPCKILVRNNIQLVVPKHAKAWKRLPFYDMLTNKFLMTLARSNVFKILWKAWEVIESHIKNGKFICYGKIKFSRPGPLGRIFNMMVNP